MKQVQATVVSVELQLEGDVASFSQDQRDNLRSLLRASLSCEEPACFLTLRIQPGSIDVQGILTIPHLPAGASAALTAPDATVAAVQAAATTLVSGLSLGVHVISSVSEIRTQANVVVPIVVAPPPPSPLPPPSPPSAPPTASQALADSTSRPSPPQVSPTSAPLIEDTGQAQSVSENDDSSRMMMIIIIGASALGGAIVAASAAMLLLRYQSRRRKRKQDADDTTAVISVVGTAIPKELHCMDGTSVSSVSSSSMPSFPPPVEMDEEITKI